MQSKWRQVTWPILAALLIVALTATPIAAQFIPKENAPWLIAKKLTVTTTSALTDDVVLGSDLTLTPSTVITVTMNATISPAGSYQPLASSGTVNTSSITAGTAGDLLTLVNTTNTSIVFTDTGTLKLTGNLTLGQYDSVTLISDGTNWVQLATSNN